MVNESSYDYFNVYNLAFTAKNHCNKKSLKIKFNTNDSQLKSEKTQTYLPHVYQYYECIIVPMVYKPKSFNR